MKIVEMNGGLGNQILEYAYGRFLEEKLGYEIYYDLMLYDCQRYINGFELTNVFPNLKFRSVREKFDMEVWVEMIKICKDHNDGQMLPHILLRSGAPIIMVLDEYYHKYLVRGKERDVGFEGPRYLVDSDYLHKVDMNLYKELSGYKNEHLYFRGIWFNKNIATSVKHLLKDELKFRELEDKQNIQYKDDMLSKEISVGLHIRRGDFVYFGKSIDEEKYSKGLRDVKREMIKKQITNVGFYVFSDDLPWCKENFSLVGLTDDDYIVYIEGNEAGYRNHLDMQLMGYCDYLIHNSGSSFCFGAVHSSEKDIVMIPV